MDPVLIQRFARQDTAPFIVVLREQADLSFIPRYAPKAVKGQWAYETLRRTAERTQKSLRALLGRAGFTYRPFILVNAIYVKGDWNLARQLAARPEVQSIIDDTPVHVEEPVTIEYQNNDISPRGDEPEWGIRMIRADSVWMQDIKGQGVVVGGQDTGFDWTHPAIQSRYRGDGPVPNHNYNWHDAIHEASPLNPDSIPNPCGYNLTVPCADHPHGTHTIGTMVGYAPDNVIGVAPQAQWIGCRNMERGWGSPASYIECFEFFLAPTDLNGENPDVTKAPDVINNSWSCPEIEGCNPSNFAIMNQVVDNLKAAGIVVVVSAGNSGGQGCSSVNEPAAIFENSFSVGATRWTDTLNFNDSIASFSSRGPVMVDSSGRLKPDISAPGQTVKSCIPDSGYAYYSGTSMAGPHVAGAVALLISANPDLRGQVDTIEYILKQTADPKLAADTCGNVPGTQVPNNTYGYGRIHLVRAVALAKTIVISYAPDPDPPAGALILFPNPATHQVRVLFPWGDGGTLTVFDSFGREVLRRQVTGFHTNFAIDDLPAGCYFVQYATDQGQTNAQLVVQ